ncbi:hypothetical protein [Arcticibacter eurypsychrophilus]|uniref:hypothetical protein n=1 Tax=Arcticibacter eurypsychrophilus TaxID=1434752 RepID=UPI00147DDC83|nr:hypothetical protein [Arcticibacter eurypsychrophilus]
MKKESEKKCAEYVEVRAILIKELGMIRANRHLTQVEKETKILQINDLLAERYS